MAEFYMSMSAVKVSETAENIYSSFNMYLTYSTYQQSATMFSRYQYRQTEKNPQSSTSSTSIVLDEFLFAQVSEAGVLSLQK